MTFCRKNLALAVCMLWAVAACGFDSYLKIDTVDGESTDPQHTKWIDIASFAQGASRTGQVAFSDLCLLKFVDASSPILAQSCAKGTHFAYATLEFVTADANRTRFYQLGLTNVLVTGLSASGSAGGGRVTETLCLSYARIGWNYTEVDPRGTAVGQLGAWWDIGRNIGSTNIAGFFTVNATQIDPGTLRLSWTGQSGRTYNILGSQTVTGNYLLVQSLTAATDGEMSLPLALTGGSRFFRVEEAP